ncbi:MAG TPA: hypothetical protein VMT63_00095 [Bacteroidales bacterium]|nr:hypothetical protein [Bacteroidales bacterium]
MPYRRLPNTDSARIRALKTALETGREMPPHKLAFSPKSLVQLQRFLPQFEQNIHLQRQSQASRDKKSKSYNEIVRKARIYLTHFVRVMNMAIYRGDLPAETRAYYGIATNDSTVPALNTENELLSWGRRIIEGEEFRIKKGGSPITNPTIAVVKVRFEQYIDALNFHATITKRTLEYSSKNSELRHEADALILNIWNDVESHFSELPEAEKRKKCEEYGLVYFFRKNELEKNGEEQDQVLSPAFDTVAPDEGAAEFPE